MATKKRTVACATVVCVLAVTGVTVLSAFSQHSGKSEEQAIKVISVSDEEMLGHLAKQFKDPKEQFADMKRKTAERRQAISEFMEKVKQDEKLFMAVGDNPLKALKDRGLLGPLDKVSLEYTNLDEVIRKGPGRYKCYWVVEIGSECNCCVRVRPHGESSQFFPEIHCYFAIPMSVRQVCVPVIE